MLFPDRQDLFMQCFIRVFPVKAFLPVHICRFRHADHSENIF
jgi:hypothetical protein